MPNTIEAKKIEEALERAKAALELIATPKRPDGTYNRDRRACELLSKETLVKIAECLKAT